MKIFLFIVCTFTTTICVAQHGHDSTRTNTTAVITTILLEQALTKKDLQNNQVRMETVVFPPGYDSRAHIHPCPLFVYVLEGELISEFEGVKKLYKPGDSFYEKANGLHSVTKNNSATTSVKILVFYLMKPGQETFLPQE